MKAISIRQPWAWLIVNGFKNIENRNWHTAYRGPLLIHASKTFDVSTLQICEEMNITLPFTFQRSGVIGSVVLSDCVTYHKSPWFTGPYGFVLTDPITLPFYLARGRLSLFEIESNPPKVFYQPPLFY